MTLQSSTLWSSAANRSATPPQENVYQSDLIAFPGPWAFAFGKQGIILVTDEQLMQLASNPDTKVNTSVKTDERMRSLRDICEAAVANKQPTIRIAFDYFWAQYREDAKGTVRKLFPDTPEYIELIGKISAFASNYGLGFELSLLSPLEIGRGYCRETGESGRWMHYREGLRDPRTGAYSVQLWRQKTWANNKGIIPLTPDGIRVFAFRETAIPGSPYSEVSPKDIVEISDSVEVERFAGIKRGAEAASDGEADPTALPGYTAERIRVFGKGKTDIGPLDRVFVVQQYRTEEMDYFSDNAAPYLHGLIDKYADAGIRINALYSDETHIQGDWTYNEHHDNGEFSVRYVSPGFEAKFAELYGQHYSDFAKWLLYFSRGQRDSENDLSAKRGSMRVTDATPTGIQQTALLRARYYELLQEHVVDLFVDAKEYLEEKMGHQVHSKAHATWAESPTIDQWDSGQLNPYAQKYEYTSNFISSNTVHQAASACYDYFKWGDFLHGTGNDTAEVGWLDRNYWGFALASSLGPLNRIRNAYAAHWGMPKEINERRRHLIDAWGTHAWRAQASLPYTLVQDFDHRLVDILTLYPIDLVAVDERFGSWMTQYAYTNYITANKLAELGKVVDGKLVVGDRSYSTLMASFEPFPSERLLTLMESMIDQSGQVIWSGPPPILDNSGSRILDRWQSLFGVEYLPTQDNGYIAAGRQISFEGTLRHIGPQTVLTDLLPDRIYPVSTNNSEIIARTGRHTVGTRLQHNKGGTAVYLGFRPRDDQSMSLGYDERHLFDILAGLDCYPASSPNALANDNTEYLSRTSEYFTARFPNGAISVAPHLRHVEENWPGGYHRDPEVDAKILSQIELPDDRLSLEQFHVNGHYIDYEGSGALSFRIGDTGKLISFAGKDCSRIRIDGQEHILAKQDHTLIAWAPVSDERKVEAGAQWVVVAGGKGEIQIPLGIEKPVTVWRQGNTPGSRGDKVASKTRNGTLSFKPTSEVAIYYVVPN
ncbi:hypothetical protein [Pelagicoccus mobilis]|uniref:Uncharacterized protein n=2 Tax=Pelagicoccus mobilis TaxID=415221 RepID=A0A934RX58_9BACT|nr:hypothetical protein [Pelagicoccus mobilis]MBK1876012.1 hypothetical protein [Pelagicoccus mobilis]